MAENPFTSAAADSAARPDRAAIARANPEIISGARWFWWIAGLSLVNSVLMHSGSDRSFVIGLGITQVADAIFEELKVVAFAIDGLVLGFFVLMGWLAGRGRLWAFVLGLVAYTGDALIYVLVGGWMSVAFHALALFYLFRGASQLRTAVKAAIEGPPVVAAEPPPAPGA